MDNICEKGKFMKNLSEKATNKKIRSCPHFAGLSVQSLSTNNGEIIHKQNT